MKRRVYIKKPKAHAVTTDIQATDLQIKAVDNVLSGKFDSTAAAMRDAGYSKTSAINPWLNLFERKGVQWYLEKINREYKQGTGITLPDKVMKVYTEGLDAKDKEGLTDHNTRKKFADEFSKFFGWKTEQQELPHQMNQYNFFSTNKDKQGEFNKNLKRFLRSRQASK